MSVPEDDMPETFVIRVSNPSRRGVDYVARGGFVTDPGEACTFDEDTQILALLIAICQKDFLSLDDVVEVVPA